MKFIPVFWAPVEEGGLGQADLIGVLPGIIDWREIATKDFLSACAGAFFTLNPWVALAGGIISSAISVLVE